MKKEEKNGSTGRTICTRSVAVASSASAEKDNSGLSLRRSARGTSSTTSTKKLATPTSSTSKSEKRNPSPVSVSKKSGKMEKKHKASPLRRSNKGKKPGRIADTSSTEIKESEDSVEDLTGVVKKYEPKMTGRSFRALYRGHLKNEAKASSNDEELVVVGCSRRVPAGNDDARDDSSSPRVNLESKGVRVGETSTHKGPDFAAKLARDTENMVLDSSPVVGDDSVIGSPSENPETQKLRVSTDTDLPRKRKRDTVGVVMDTCANTDDRTMSADGVSGPASSRDYGENRRNMQQDKSHDQKLSSMYPEYWVPVQLSDVQIEQYCRTLFSKSSSLSSLSRTDPVGALEQTLSSVRKICDHPYIMDASFKQLLTKNLEVHKIEDVEIKASGKLHLLDAMLTQIKSKGFKAVIFYQATQSGEGLMLANILDDFVSQRFGQNSYEHGDSHSKKNAINNFNKESECFILLLEKRACSQSIKLLRAEALILFRSSWNSSHDVKLLEKIKIESYSEKTKIFRLYSTCTVEEKALILARQKKSLDNLNRPLTHALLMWGASCLFDKLDHFHGSQTPDSGVPLEQSIRGDVIREFSSILSSSVGEGNVGKLCLLLEAKHAQGTYSTESTLFGEKYVELSDEVSPNIFWTKLLGGKNPVWTYYSDTSQRSRKRVRHLQGSEETAKLDDGKNTKKKKKASDDVAVVYDERKASGKDHIGFQEKGEECMAEKRGSHYSSVTKDVEKTISDIKKKCSKSLHKLVQTLEEEKMDLMNRNAVKKQELQNCKKVEASFIRVTYSGINTQSLHDALQRLECTFERKFDDLKGELDECLESLEQINEAGKKKLAEDEACWISRIEKWARAELRNGAPNQAWSNADNSLDQQNEEACSLDKEIPDELALPLPNPASLVKTRGSAESDQVDHEKPDSAENIQGKKTETAVEPQPAGSRMPSSPGEKQHDLAANVQGQNIESAIEAQPVESSMPSSLAGQQSDPAVNIQSKNIETSIDPRPAESSMPSSPAGQQSDPAVNIQEKDNEAVMELQPAESTVPSSLAGQQTDPAVNIETVIEPQSAESSMPSSPAGQIQGKDIEARMELQPAESPVPSSPAGQQSDPAVNVETVIEPQPAESSMPSSPGGKQPDPAENIQGKNIEETVESKPAGSETLETGGFAASEQVDQVACPSPSSPAGNQPDSGANIESQSISTSAEPHIAGPGAVLHQDACSLPSPSVGTQADIAANTEGQNTTTVSNAVETDNVAPLVHEGVVESSAGVIAPVPSLLNNATATTVQPVPQIPFPVFSDPFQHELEKLRRQSEITKKTCEEMKAVLKAKFEKKIAELQEEYQRKFHEVQAVHAARKTKLQTRKNLVIKNKLLSSAFLSKCTSRISSHSSAATPMGKFRIQQLAQRATQVSALRNHTASAPYCTMPQPRQPLISNPLPYSNAFIQQQEQPQNLGSGLQRSNDVVCLSDDE
ncbi:hypothetical protein F2Q70_00041987 [Brassica cretica]|uniref:Helicase C-terminal domain-containing protein n=1 Tax=Brassica cretica TaxID=69181 RepID=A0A8S9K361_BRACR|nr:hypothetical protein F2Q70_00041987 [Brassica cretica]